jgi:hypothetical protein
MAAGDRKLKLTEFRIPNATPVSCVVNWSWEIEDKSGQDRPARAGELVISLGPWSSAQSLTLGQVRTQAIAALTANTTLPERDSVS